jgi:hypothetical protein
VKSDPYILRLIWQHYIAPVAPGVSGDNHILWRVELGKPDDPLLLIKYVINNTVRHMSHPIFPPQFLLPAGF